MVITNTFKIKKIVPIKVYLNYFSDYISEEVYFTLIENITYFILMIITLKVNENKNYFFF